MRLSVLIPVYNEGNHVGQLIERVLNVPVDLEVVLVDDSSTDNTWAVLSAVADPRVHVHRHAVNRGKGAGVCTALEHATGDLVIIQDADLEYDPSDYPTLLAPILEGRAQVVYGMRDFSQQTQLSRAGNRFLTLATNVLFGSRLSDMETCYKMMPREVMQALHLVPSRFQIEPEITAKLLSKGYDIYEVPISYHPRSMGQKKLNPWKDGLPALTTLLKYRFDRTWLTNT